MMSLSKFSGLLASAAFVLLAQAVPASAASVTCGNLTLGTRTATVDPALVGGLCYAQNGNLQNADIAALGLATVDKDTTGDFPTGDNSEGALQFTRTTATSGAWSFASSVWTAWDTLYLAFHFGGGGNTADDNPDSFVVQLARADTSGTYALGGGQLNGLSNIYLLGVRCTTPGGCDSGGQVSEPAALALLGLGLVGIAAARRRRAA